MTISNRWFRTVSWAGILILLWWLLTDGAVSSWWIGVPAILLALSVSTAQVSPAVLVFSELPRFLMFFVKHSLLGAVDVARRVLQRNMSIAPELYEYTMRLPLGLPQVTMANCVGLLPGTLSVKVENNMLTVHILDKHTDFLAELELVESNIARIFGIAVHDSKAVQ